MLYEFRSVPVAIIIIIINEKYIHAGVRKAKLLLTKVNKGEVITSETRHSVQPVVQFIAADKLHGSCWVRGPNVLLPIITFLFIPNSQQYIS
jgi:hypothetical protein